MAQKATGAAARWVTVGLLASVVALTAVWAGIDAVIGNDKQGEAQLPAQVLAPGANAVTDWPAYRGARGDGASLETGWRSSWESMPKPRWTRDVGVGASSMVIVGDRVYTKGNRRGTAGAEGLEGQDRDVIYCLNAANGQVIWEYAYPVRYERRSYEGGTASTPTVADGRVIVVSHEGHMVCLNAADGSVAWSKHLTADFNGRRPRWGYSSSAAVHNGVVIAEPGAAAQSIIGLNLKDGSVRWRTPGGAPGYSTPVFFEHGGKTLAAVFQGSELVIIEPMTGRRIAAFPWTTRYDVNAAMPLVLGEHIFISSGYRYGCAMLRFTGDRLIEVWRNNNMENHFNSSVYHEGVIFGIHGNAGRRSELVAVNATNGEQLWSVRGYGGGSLILVNGQLVVLGEEGQLAIGPASREGFTPTAEGKPLNNRCWASPAFSNGCLYVRDNVGNMACYDLRAAAAEAGAAADGS